MRILFAATIVFLSTMAQPLTAQVLDSHSYPLVMLDTKALSANYEKAYSLTLPFFGKKDARTMALMGISVMLISRIDDAIDEEYAIEGHPFLMKALRSYAGLGELFDSGATYPAIGGIVVATVGFSYLNQQPEARALLKQIAQAVVLSSAITGLLKTSVGRNRPYLNKGPYEFELLEFRTKPAYLSFPSGHTSSIFSAMTVLAMKSSSAWLKRAAYGFAVSVGFQRITDRRHWASDVVAGGLIGYLTGKWVVHRQQRSQTKLRFVPFMDGMRYGLAISF